MYNQYVYFFSYTHIYIYILNFKIYKEFIGGPEFFVFRSFL